MPFDQNERQRFQRYQRTVAHVASHPRLREVVEELEDDPNTFNNAQGNPKGYLRGKGLDVDDEWTVEVSHDSPLRITICLNGWCGSFTW
jgi:hypothetical protein